MSKALMIIICGPHCTGKTTLGKKIAAEFRLPFLSKDEVKECLFDNLGCGSIEHVQKYRDPAYLLTYYFVRSLLAADASFVMEGNYRPQYDHKHFRKLEKEYDFVPFQISCFADGKLLLERFAKRSQAPDRHPGHLDHLSLAEFKGDILGGKSEKLDIGGYYYEIDTTDFSKIDYDKLFAAIKTAMAEVA
jgi:predicted kinase